MRFKCLKECTIRDPYSNKSRRLREDEEIVLPPDFQHKYLEMVGATPGDTEAIRTIEEQEKNAQERLFEGVDELDLDLMPNDQIRAFLSWAGIQVNSTTRRSTLLKLSTDYLHNKAIDKNKQDVVDKNKKIEKNTAVSVHKE